MMATKTSRGIFTYIVQTRSGRLPSNNRDRGNLLPIFFVLVLALLPVVRLSPNNCSNSNTRQKKEPRWKGFSTLFSCFRINWGSCYFWSVNPLPRTFDHYVVGGFFLSHATPPCKTSTATFIVRIGLDGIL